MNKIASVDVVIFGGGIAGLWTLSRLRQDGYSAILLESGSLGGGQTIKSQGIIHGGLKYALTGNLTAEAQALNSIPAIWKACLQGKGEIDLNQVPILANHQFLWSPNKFTAKLTAFFASTTLTSKVSALNRSQFPSIFQHPWFKGDVFALDEIVIDIPILIRELVKANQEAVYKIEPVSEEGLFFNSSGKLTSVSVYMAGKSVEIKAKAFIFCAGSGNEVIIRKLKKPDLAMQLRPLHMVIVKTPFNYPLYAHCLGFGSKPRLTITTHFIQEGKAIWYLGGQIAEDGIHFDSHKQIQRARSELSSLFPWLDFSFAEFSTMMINRSETKQKNDSKPESIFFKKYDNIFVAWPTKLSLAPLLASQLLKTLRNDAISHEFLDIQALRSWPMPPLAQPIWENAFCKSVA